MLKNLKEEIEHKNIIIMTIEQQNVIKEYKKSSLKPLENNVFENISLKEKNDNINGEKSKKSNIIENYLNSQQKSNLNSSKFCIKRKFSEFSKNYETKNNNIPLNDENNKENQENKENIDNNKENIILNFNKSEIIFDEKTPKSKIIDECNSSFFKRNMLSYREDDKIILNGKNKIAIEFEKINKDEILNFKTPFKISNKMNILNDNTNIQQNENKKIINHSKIILSTISNLKNNNLLLNVENQGVMPF